MTSTAADLDTAADTAAGVLAFARDRRAAADAAEADLLHAACAWADLHAAESIHEAALLSRHGEPSSRRLAPSVSWPSLGKASTPSRGCLGS